MAKVITFEQVNAHAAAIDIGAAHVFVSTDGVSVNKYETFTADYRQLVKDLKDKGIKQVCMEATGVYWISLHQMLEQGGLEVCLVNPKEVKQVKGRKTDPNDCRWIQRVFSAGLVRQSYVPAGVLKELRMIVRERDDIISMSSTYVNKMQRALELMNIKLTGILAQVHGKSSIRMIEAMLAGERDPAQLLLLCDKIIIKNKSEKVLKALDGNYNDTWLFLLGENLKLWKLHEAQIAIIDGKISELLDQLESGRPEVKAATAAKKIRHHAPKIENLHQKLLNIYGVDANTLSGVNDYTLLRLLAETGTDMSRFPSAGHFASWCQLSPMQNNSGKMRRNVRIRNGSKAGQTFRMIAQSLIESKYIAIGAFMRRIRSKKGPQAAIKAGGRKVAVAFYNLLTKGAAYVEQGVKKYEEQIIEREQAFLRRLAHKHNLKIISNSE